MMFLNGFEINEKKFFSSKAIKGPREWLQGSFRNRIVSMISPPDRHFNATQIRVMLFKIKVWQ